MIFSGFTDEAGGDLDVQLAALKALGWKNFEARGLFGANLSYISDENFELLQRKLDENGVKIHCFGSGVANWAHPVTEPPDTSFDEMRRAVPRMQKLGIKYIRIMSFAVPEELKPFAFNRLFPEVIKRLRTIVKMAEDGGIICLHENCMNWGGLSWEHTRALCETIDSPAFRLVYDTGNPVFNLDVRGNKPYKRQSSWEFYSNVKEFISHIHIKDAKIVDEKPVYTYPGEGEGDVVRILADAFKNGYDGAISIEPHLVHVFHEKDRKADENRAFNEFVEYGRRIEKIVTDIRKDIGK